jgi:MFS family permease
VPTAVLLYGVFFLLRLSGQGMMTHTSVTSVARHYERDRGKAVAIVSLGLPVGEAVLPLTAVALVGVVGWRLSWVAAALLLVLVVVPLVIWLLGGEAARNRTAGATMAAPDERTGRQWSRREVLGDKRFYLILPAVIASSYIITGLFFHQAHLAEAKGWSLAWIATCFVGYAAGTVVAALAAGPMVDRVGAGRLLHLYLLPLAFGLLLLVVGRQPLVALVYMTLAGIGAGAGYTIVNALWAEIYGVTHLGAIRSLVFSFSVLGSGLSPVSMGWLIDAGVSIESIAAGSLGYVLVASVLLGLAIPRRRR